MERVLTTFIRPRRLKEEDANRPEQLVPIRLEFDVEHHKMRDTFVWNLNGERVHVRCALLRLTCPRSRHHTRNFRSVDRG